MKELHLKFKSDTGSPRCTELDIEFKEHATDEYLEWLEELAEKYFKQNLSRFTRFQLEDELIRRKLREMNRQMAAERAKTINTEANEN